MEGATVTPGKKPRKITDHIELDFIDRSNLHTDQDIWKKIKILEEQMFLSAKNLEFESAANIRDEIASLKKMVDGIV
jgi:excinuclease ABC subunit B